MGKKSKKSSAKLSQLPSCPLGLSRSTAPAIIKKGDKHKLNKKALLQTLREKAVTLNFHPAPIASGAASDPHALTYNKKKHLMKKRNKNKSTALCQQISNRRTSADKNLSTAPIDKRTNIQRNDNISEDNEAVKTSAVTAPVTEKACKQRRNRKRKRQGDADAAATATENAKTTYCSPSLLGSKKCKQEAKEHQSKETHNEEVVASSDSEPELIHADWELAEESSENDEKEIEASKDSSTEEDLDTSEQDIDEEIPKDLSSSAESESVEDDDICDEDDEEEGDEVTEDDGGEESGMEQEDVPSNLEQPGATLNVTVDKKQLDKNIEFKPTVRCTTKKFSLNDKAAILKEINSRTAELNSRSIYLAPIPGNCNFDMLKKLIPTMTSCQFMTKPKTNKLRSYVFVEFPNPETAARERRAVSGRLFAGKTVRAELKSANQRRDADHPAKQSEDAIDFSRLIVSGLTPTVTPNDLQTLFSAAESVRMSTPPNNGSNYGSASLNYVSPAVALDAFSDCHQFLLKGHPISVNFALKPSSTGLATQVNRKSATEATALLRPGTTLNPQPSLPRPSQPEHHQPTPPAASRVGKVLIQPLSDADSDDDENTNHNLLKTADLLKPKVIEKNDVKTPTLIMASVIKKKLDEQTQESDYSDDDSFDENEEDGESSENEEDNDDEEDDSSDEDGANEDDSDDEDVAEEETDDVKFSDEGEENEDAEAEEASLKAVLDARKACARALKAPGSKRNWNAGRKLPESGSMPKLLPVPAKCRR